MTMEFNHDIQYGPLNTSLRVKETQLLAREEYERLIYAADYDEALNLLSNTPYREKIEHARTTHDYQTLVMDELKETYQWLKTVSPDPILFEALTLKYVYHNVKVLFKERLMGTSFSEVLIDVGPYPIYALRQAINEGENTLDSPYLMQNIINLRHNFDSIDDYQGMDIFIDRAYMHHLKRLAEAMENQALREYFEKNITETNILIFFRALRLGHSARNMGAIITDEGAVSTQKFMELAEYGEAEAVNYFMQRSDSRPLFEQAMSEDGKLSITRLEQAIDESLLKQLSAARFEVFGPLPIVYYIARKELEADQLRLILASKLNDIEPSIVIERMRLDYAV